MTTKTATRRFFGWTPCDTPAYVYNSVLLIVGAAFLADTGARFTGIVMIGEALLVTIERCWPKGERPE